MRKVHIITSTSATATYFYVGSKKWSDERPDALEFNNLSRAKDFLADRKERHHENSTWQIAIIKTEEKE